MDKIFEKLIKKELIWLPEFGMGYFPVKSFPYDEKYFQKYEDYSNTEMGERIKKERCDFVERNLLNNCDTIVDIGIGCGQFAEEMKKRGENIFGFDVNPTGIKWLKERKKFLNPYKKKIDVATFWDSIEHIEDHHLILKNVRSMVFVSLPIFKHAGHILRSKHFKKDEHCWYWSHEGFIGWMKRQGFECIEFNDKESEFGREDIWSYAFKRI